jgi:hypothetical protein
LQPEIRNSRQGSGSGLHLHFYPLLAGSAAKGPR